MLPSRSNGAVWMDGEDEDEGILPWPPRTTNNDEMNPSSLTTFRSMLETPDCCFTNTTNAAAAINNHHQPSNNQLLYQPELFTSLLFNPCLETFDPSHPFLPPKSSFLPNSLFHSSINFDNGFDLTSCDPNFFPAPDPDPDPEPGHVPPFMGFNGPTSSQFLPFPDDAVSAAIGGSSNAAFGFDGFDTGGGLFPNRAKVLRPLEVSAPVGAQPTLFQKRAALRQSLGVLSSKSDEGVTSLEDTGETTKKRKRSYGDEEGYYNVGCGGGGGGGVSGLNYDSDEFTEKLGEGNGDMGGDGSNANSGVTGGGDQKGKKKKGMPAKNLMAERRRRKKLNDRLYMLRSVVPKISKV